MLTVSKLAKELNVSVQTIYRTLNNVEPNKKEQMTVKIRGIAYFTEFGEQYIKERLMPVKQNTEKCLASLNIDKHHENDEILFLREQNKALLRELEKEREHNRAALEKEREHGRQQAERITNLAEKMAELTHNNQILLKQEQDKNILLLPSGPQPSTTENEQQQRSFLSRVFKRAPKENQSKQE